MSASDTALCLLLDSNDKVVGNMKVAIGRLKPFVIQHTRKRSIITDLSLKVQNAGTIWLLLAKRSSHCGSQIRYSNAAQVRKPK